MRETTALGAAIAAGFAMSVWTDFEQLQEMNLSDRTIFQPAISRDEGAKMFRRWENGVRMCRGWLSED